MTEPVVKTINVPCSQETAFNVFTSDMGKWWPKDRHSVSAMNGGAEAQKVSMDARVGGALTEIAHDGKEHNWGSVKTFDPHSQLELLWHIGKPVEEATIVEVTFKPKGSGTQVTLKHHGWEALGEDADKMREGYNSGWVHVFETCFFEACQTINA